MASREQRSNKEKRKPKKEKAAPAAPTPFGSAVKQAGAAAAGPKKSK